MATVTTSGSKSQLISSGGFSQQIQNPTNFASSALSEYASAVHALVTPIVFGTLVSTVYVPQNAIILRISAALVTAFDGSANLEVGSSGALATPSAPVVTVGGTAGSTTYGYKVVANNADGTHSIASAANAAFTTGNATLSATNFNHLVITAVTGAASYDVYRTVGGATQGKIGNTTSLTFNDTGLVGDGGTAPASATAGQDLMSPVSLAAGGTYGVILESPVSSIQIASGQPLGVQAVVLTITGAPTVGAGSVLIEYSNAFQVALQN